MARPAASARQVLSVMPGPCDTCLSYPLLILERRRARRFGRLPAVDRPRPGIPRRKPCARRARARGPVPEGGRRMPVPHTLVAQSEPMREVVRLAHRIAPNDVAVLILGEPGVGKHSVALEIHRRSSRAAGPLVRVACGGIPEVQLDDRLFGRERVGPAEPRERSPACFERARGGTLFLDDVARLPFWAQVKLLDVAQQRECHAFGLPGGGRSGVRLLASATSDIEAAVARNEFYCGLYYYLIASCVRVPPLRDRREDIPALAERLLVEAARRCGLPAGAPQYRFSSDAIECLSSYGWPGNVRELASVVVRAAILADTEEIGRECVAGALRRALGHAESETLSVPLAGGLKEIERHLIREAVRRCRGNKAAAARSLGLHRRTLYRLLEEKTGDDEPVWLTSR